MNVRETILRLFIPEIEHLTKRLNTNIKISQRNEDILLERIDQLKEIVKSEIWQQIREKYEKQGLEQ